MGEGRGVPIFAWAEGLQKDFLVLFCGHKSQLHPLFMFVVDHKSTHSKHKTGDWTQSLNCVHALLPGIRHGKGIPASNKNHRNIAPFS